MCDYSSVGEALFETRSTQLEYHHLVSHSSFDVHLPARRNCWTPNHSPDLIQHFPLPIGINVIQDSYFSLCTSLGRALDSYW